MRAEDADSDEVDGAECQVTPTRLIAATTNP